jgi:ABC-2 type transport system ATP-binding protein
MIRQDNIITVSNLSISISKRKILDDICFDLPRGKVCAFIGPNGAGKTTTIKCILNLYPKFNGKIKFFNQDKFDILFFKKIGYVPEKENFQKIKLNNFLWFLAKSQGMNKNKFQEKLKEFSEVFEISSLLDQKINNLSSGEKKKILIIQALLHEPDLLIMDEPTENMDPDMRQRFYDVIKTLNKRGVTIFISTHQLDEIKHHINHAIFIKDGKIIFNDKVDSKSNLYKIYNRLNKSVI